MIYNQVVTCTAFAFLAMFLILFRCDMNLVLCTLFKLNYSKSSFLYRRTFWGKFLCHCFYSTPFTEYLFCFLSVLIVWLFQLPLTVQYFHFWQYNFQLKVQSKVNQSSRSHLVTFTFYNLILFFWTSHFFGTILNTSVSTFICKNLFIVIFRSLF